MQRLSQQSGQVTSEFILIVTSVLFMLGIVSANSKKLCELSNVSDADDCGSITVVFEKVVSKNIEEITSIINLPW